MKILGPALALVLVATVSACEAAEDPIMPNVVGTSLDVALTTLEDAGINREPEVEGGGLFGIVEEANWQVCTQSPAAGEAVSGTPQLAVDRECGTDESEPGPVASESATPEETETAEPETSETPSEAPEATEVLTVDNNADLAELLSSSPSDDLTGAFAEKYTGRTIQFDGYISALAQHGDYATRFDLLVSNGEYDEAHVTGPDFKYEDVNMSYDMHFVGDNVPDSVGVGDKVTVTMVLEEWDEFHQVFFADPVETRYRD